jgi:hypothetical protein
MGGEARCRPNKKTSKGYEEYRQIIDFAVMRKITYP